MSWTDERVEQLRQAWLEGRSASQIAGLLGHGLTRNAVIGKVHRLGLSGRARPPAVGASQTRDSAAAHDEPQVAQARPVQVQVQVSAPVSVSAPAARIVRGATALAMQPEALTVAQPEAMESVVLPMSVRVTIVELKESMCRWPLGDPTNSEFRYCGSPTHSGPYCSHHGGLAYQPTDARRRERERRLALR